MIEINEMLDNAEINLNIQDNKPSNNTSQNNLPLNGQNNTNFTQDSLKDTKEKYTQKMHDNSKRDFEIRKRRFALHVIKEAKQK